MNVTASTSSPFLYLAPIRGITDALFRNIYHHHFPYFDAAIAPFINPQRNADFKEKFMADVLPENNSGLPVIPQLLNNTVDDFAGFAGRLRDLGYTEVNWNLGCPAPMVANKKRGSGLLPHTDRIVALLQEVIPGLGMELSIKTRLGYSTPDDIELLLPRLQEMAIKEIIIHPRIGKQLYRGHADPDRFDRCRRLSDHPLVYNGDIVRLQDYISLAERFPEVERWMIGRGAIGDPFLAAAIRGISFTAGEKKERLLAFHGELYTELKGRLSGPSHLLGRLKQIWAYFINSFPAETKALKKIQKVATEQQYKKIVDEIFCNF